MSLSKAICKRCHALEHELWRRLGPPESVKWGQWCVGDDQRWEQGRVECMRLRKGDRYGYVRTCDSPHSGCIYAAEHAVSQGERHEGSH